MKRAWCLALLTVAFTAGSAMAQGPMMPKGKWWRMPEVAKQLKLTAEQQTKLDGVFNASQTELIDLKADADKLGIELRAHLEKPQVARKEALAAAQKLGAARGRLFEREVAMMVDMKSVLTEEQWSLLRTKLAERMGNRMRDEMREGGDGPPPRQGNPNRRPR
ncbi:MAG: periplasmic heavy metal sensor [Thermoanaerobaculia bacterium]|nr:periplasmic heavy metal sensor [Thermoanaerobaculia bacterium]